MDTKSQRNLNKVSADLKDINKIMTKSIHDIINRGAKIEGNFIMRVERKKFVVLLSSMCV
jgi:hypothetical protein